MISLVNPIKLLKHTLRVFGASAYSLFGGNIFMSAGKISTADSNVVEQMVIDLELNEKFAIAKR